MKKLILVIFFYLIKDEIMLAQAVSCGTPDSMSIQANKPSLLQMATCPNLMNYYPYNPGSVSPLKTIIPLNFIYIGPTSGSGNWDTVSALTSARIVSLLNKHWDSLVPPDKPLPAPYTAPFYSDIKINFSYKATYHIPDSAYYHFTGSDAKRLIPDTNAINIFYACAAHAGNAIGIPSRMLIMNGDSADTFAANDMVHSGQIDNVSHELAHCLGLWHTNEYITAQGTTATLTTSNSSGTFRSKIVDDYWVEDPSQWAHIPGHGNNYMSYNWDYERYMSPKQMAYIHYMLTNHPLLKNIPTSRVPANTGCTLNHSGDISINSNITLSGAQLYPTGDIIIQSGAQVVLNSCMIMREGAKVIIEPGAKFSILGGGISTLPDCPGLWWGIEVRSTQNALQSLNSSNPSLPGTGVGMLELDHATLANAHCAVYVSQDAGLAIGNNVPGTGAGIVYSKNSTFLNNQYGMYFDTYYTLGGATNNLSYSRRDSFVVNSDFKTTVGNSIPIHAIRIENANGIQILGDYFEDTHHMTSTGIAVIDSDVDIRDHCASSGCSGTQMRNRFYGFRSAIDVLNSFNIVPANIDHVEIVQGGDQNNNTEGGIYILNSLAPRIVNNDITTANKPSPYNRSYDLYLDNCDAYTVQKNIFQADINSRTIGAVVNNSGPSTNFIYNNTFYTLNQCIWAQFQNYDPVTGQGLKMNCNDFLQSTQYHIGVQGYNGATTGVDQVQGQANFVHPEWSVRNKYGNSYFGGCSSGSESKFFIDTQTGFVVTDHGSFQDSVFHPMRQTNNSCSNPNEITCNMQFNAPSPSKSVYCLDTILIGYSKTALQEKISTIRDNRDNLALAYAQALDGGNTQHLLDYIANYPSPLNATQLKDTLTSKDFLSDTVLKAYFLLSGPSEGQFNEVFIKNYPLQPDVWAIASNLNIDHGILEDWDNRQHENTISTRENQRGDLLIAIDDAIIYGNEKVRRFLTDTTGPQYDSIIAHYSLNETAMSKWNLARTYIAANQIDQADALINDLESADTANADACRMLRYTRRLATDQTYADTMRADSSIYEYLLDRATYSLKPIKEGYSRVLLKIVYDHYVIPERLYPEGEGSRPANDQTQVQKVLEEKNQILIYPNPASQSLNVKVNKDKGPFTVKIIGLDGKVLIEQSCAQDCEISLLSLINGVYLLNLYKDTQLLQTKKVIVIK